MPTDFSLPLFHTHFKIFLIIYKILNCPPSSICSYIHLSIKLSIQYIIPLLFPKQNTFLYQPLQPTSLFLASTFSALAIDTPHLLIQNFEISCLLTSDYFLFLFLGGFLKTQVFSDAFIYKKECQLIFPISILYLHHLPIIIETSVLGRPLVLKSDILKLNLLLFSF